MPPFVGNTVRGALGHALYKHFRHVYTNMLKVEGSTSIPNPFVISVPYPSRINYYAGEILAFCVTLFGSACAFEEEVTNAAELMCEGKLAGTRLAESQQTYNLQWNDTGAEQIPNCDMLTVNFLTPTEIYAKNQLLKQLGFPTFIERLFGRISAIIDNYGEHEFVLPYRLISNKPFVTAESNLHVAKFNTGGTPVEGFCGQVRYYGDVTRYLPYIDLGCQTHIGKKTTRACGEYDFTFS